MCIFLRILTIHVDNKDSCPSVFCLLLKHGLKNEFRGGGRERFAASKDAPAFGKYNKMHRSGAKEQKDSKIISFLWQKNSYHLLHFEFWVFTDLQLQDADSCIKNASWNPPTFFLVPPRPSARRRNEWRTSHSMYFFVGIDKKSRVLCRSSFLRLNNADDIFPT